MSSFDRHQAQPRLALKTDAILKAVDSRNKVSSNDAEVPALSASAFTKEMETPLDSDFDRSDSSGVSYNAFTGNQLNIYDISGARWDEFIDFDAST